LVTINFQPSVGPMSSFFPSFSNFIYSDPWTTS